MVSTIQNTPFFIFFTHVEMNRGEERKKKKTPFTEAVIEILLNWILVPLGICNIYQLHDLIQTTNTKIL